MNPLIPRAAAALMLLLSAAAGAEQAPADDITAGEIRKIDRAAGTVTLKHDYIAAIDMPPMTMVFAVEPPTLLDGLKVGDAVRFVVDVRAGRMLVTRIEPVPKP